MTTSTTTSTQRRDRVATTQGRRVMHLLGEHVPLSLIMDLTMPLGPHSNDILVTEGAPEFYWWVKP